MSVYFVCLSGLCCGQILYDKFDVVIVWVVDDLIIKLVDVCVVVVVVCFGLDGYWSDVVVVELSEVNFVIVILMWIVN